MANNGSIDEVIGSEAGKQVDVLTEKMNALYVAFKQNITAINLVNDALSKSVSIKDVSENVDKATKSTKKLKDVQTEFVQTVQNLDKAVTHQGDVLNDTERAYAKLTATMANGNKTTKLATDEVVKETKAVDNLSGAFKRLNDDHKAALLYAKNVGAEYGFTSVKFKEAAFSANLLGNQIKTMNSDLGNHGGNVGNYASDIEKALAKANVPAKEVKLSLQGIWSGLRTVANILPGIGLAGMFGLAFEGASLLYDKLTNVNKELTEVGAAYKTMNEALNSGDYKSAIINVEKLTDEIALAKQGFIDKSVVLKEYNETIGKTIGHATTLDEAEKLIVEHGEAYIKMMLMKAVATAALDESAKSALAAEKALAEKKNEIDSKTNDEGVYKPGALKSFQLLFTQGLGSDESNLEKQVTKTVDKIKKEGDLMSDIASKYLKSASEIAKANGINFDPVKTGNDTKTGTPNEVNRISELKNQFEAEKLVVDQYQEENKEDELTYRTKLLTIVDNYAGEKQNAIKNLNEHEKDSQTTFNKELVALTNQSTDAIKKAYEKHANEYQKQVDDNNKRLEDDARETAKTQLDILTKQLKDEQDLINGNLAANAEMWDKADDEDRKKKQSKYEWEVFLLHSFFDIASSISDSLYAKEFQRIDDKDNKLQDAHNKEIKRIEQSGLTTIQQTKAKAKEDAQYEVQKKKIDKDRKKALHEQAVANKALTLTEISLTTLLAVMNALNDKTVPYPVRVGYAISAGAVGAINLLKAAIVPIPQYFKGRGKTGKGEYAIVGDHPTLGGAQELIKRENGKMELTPAKPTLTYLNPNDEVISHKDLIKNASYVHLMKQGNVSTSTNDKFQSAEIVEEIKDLKKVLINKNLSVTTTNYSGFDSYLKANIR